MAKEYWRWTEYRWTSPDVKLNGNQFITCGIDVGSVSTQAVIMLDGKLFAYSNTRTGSSSPESAKKALDWALETTGLPPDKIQYIVGTGYGRVNMPFANKTVTEIACHGRGANFIYGSTVKTVLDMGGQDCKAIRIDEKGAVQSFLMNDKCAAGTGRGMEVFADLVSIPIEEVGALSLSVDKEPPPVSNTCVIFAKSEASALLEEGWEINKVLAAYCSAMAHRVVSLLQRVGVEKDFAITGGISKNVGVVKRIEKELGLEALKPKIDAQIAGAIGAALFAKAFLAKGGK